jgi:protein arginine kinase activator
MARRARLQRRGGRIGIAPEAEAVIKCQKCSKPATIHITEIVKGNPLEFHLCEDHARQQLTAEEPAQTANEAEKKLAKWAGRKDTSELDKQTCPMCGISFLEFRNAGRLGCPNDYEAFREELIPLLENIHGETQHAGKVPKRVPQDRRQQMELIQLRHALRLAVAAEDYEEAARLRDRIQQAEKAK